MNGTTETNAWLVEYYSYFIVQFNTIQCKSFTNTNQCIMESNCVMILDGNRMTQIIYVSRIMLHQEHKMMKVLVNHMMIYLALLANNG